MPAGNLRLPLALWLQVEYCQPLRADWRQQPVIDASSTAGVVLQRVHVSNATHACKFNG